jgi:hypothetical protein
MYLHELRRRVVFARIATVQKTEESNCCLRRESNANIAKHATWHGFDWSNVIIIVPRQPSVPIQVQEELGRLGLIHATRLIHAI